MFGFGLGLRRGIGAALSGGGWSPLSLFQAGEQGVWYDPSDFSTMFQDSAGTTPVTAVEQPVGLILDKRLGAIAGAELIVNGSFNTDTVWVKDSGWTISGGRAIHTGAGDYIKQGSVTPGTFYECVIDVAVANGTGYPQLYLGDAPAIASMTAPGIYTYRAKANANTFGFAIRGVNACEVNSVSIRELLGNHASQATTAQKPTLSARVNLLTYSEQFDNAAWTKTEVSISANAAVAPDGTMTADYMIESVANSTHIVRRSITFTAGSHTLSIYAKQGVGSARSCAVLFNTSGQGVTVNLSTGAILNTIGTPTVVITDVGGGWWKIAVTATIAAGTQDVRYYIGNLTDAPTAAWVGDGTSGIYIWGAQLEAGSTATIYQRIAAATDYDTAGFLHYLKFDGVDDGLATAAIDFTATDKMTVCAGVRKLSTVAAGMLCELSASSSTNTGAFWVFDGTSGGVAGDRMSFRSRGTIAVATETAVLSAPRTLIVTGIGDISGDSCVTRADGVAGTPASVDQGTGNFGNYPLYIGRRGGASLPFNGHIYSLIVRGAATADVTAAEAYVAAKTGVTL